MTKYHISKKGNPAICRAKEGNCPLGGANEHYDSKEEAREAISKKEEKKHSILPGISEVPVTSEVDDRSELQKEFVQKIKDAKAHEVENEMRYHKAEELKDSYELLQEIKKGKDIKETLEELSSQRNFISEQIQKRRNEIVTALQDKSEKLNKLQKEHIDLSTTLESLEDQVKENNGGTCPKCGKGHMVERSSKYGEFIGCSRFPECKHTQKKLAINPSINKKLKELDEKISYETSLIKQKAQSVEDPEISDLEKQSQKLSKEIEIAKYIDKYKNPVPTRNDIIHKRKPKSTETPIEEYYQKRRIADEAIKSQIGENDLVLSSGKMSYGYRNELEANLSIDRKGQINNLYLESGENLGEVKKVVKINSDGSLQLENGENVTFSHSRNWRMDNLVNRNKDTGPSNRWKLYTTPTKGQKYYGNKTLTYVLRDSGD